MKTILSLATAATALLGASALGQGYFLFTGPVRGVWESWSTGVFRTSTNSRVAFLWGTGVPIVDSIAVSTPTNNWIPFDWAAAWNAIMSDPNFHIANTTDGIAAVAQSAANGAWSYNISGTFPVEGTTPGAYQVFVIGWPATYADPAAAAAAGTPVGWSNPFTYVATDALGTPPSMAQSGFQPFGYGIPEPAMPYLVGLGAATLLLRRRTERIQTTVRI